MGEIKTRLEKRGGDKYVFITETERFTRTEEVDKKVLLELYDESNSELQKYLEQLKNVNKDLERLGVVEDEELKKFLDLANKAAKYNEYQKKVEARDGLLDMLDRLRKQKEDIERLEPSVKRAKK